MQAPRFDIAALETKTFAIAGSRFEVLEATAPFDLVIYDRAGGITAVIERAEVGWYLAAPYSSIEVRNGPTAQRLRLWMGPAQGGSKQQPGTVSVIDSAQQAVVGGRVFRARYFLASAGAPNWTKLILSNEGTAPDLLWRVTLRRLFVTSAGIVSLGAVPRAQIPGGLPTPTTFEVRNLRASGPHASTPIEAYRYVSADANVPGLNLGTPLVLGNCAAGREVIGYAPQVLDNDFAIVLLPATQAQDLTVEVEWVEDRL